jgi:uracil-DNA glycosylase
MDPVAAFLAILEKGPAETRCVFNPWRDHDARDCAPRRHTPRLRRENLHAYLCDRRQSARIVLVGEAPSHRGARFTGIPFCSEVELRQKAELVARRPLAMTSADHASRPQRERSAAVVWGELDRYGCAFDVVLWNAFPWHPYRAEVADVDGPCGPSSNRRPRPSEVDQGRAALRALLRCFTHPLEVFAVGRVAELALSQWPEARAAGCLRHPAQGGEALFRQHFAEMVASRL